MGTYIDREGTGRGEIVDYGLKEYDSGAVAINIRVRIDEWYDFDTKEWLDWSEYGFEVDGAVWVVKKDGGGLNTKSIENFVKCTYWDGSFDSIAQQTFQPAKVQVSIKGEDYQGATFFKIAFVNEWDRVPNTGGALSNIDAPKASLLQKQYASAMRAVVANAKRSQGQPPVSKPPAPKPTRQPVAANGTPPADDIPF